MGLETQGIDIDKPKRIHGIESALDFHAGLGLVVKRSRRFPADDLGIAFISGNNDLAVNGFLTFIESGH